MNVIKNYLTRNMLVMLLFCAIFFGGIFGYKIFGKMMMNRHFDSMPMPTATISTAEVKQYNWPLELSAIGTIQAINSVDVTTEATGVIESIKFASGEQVVSGDILVELSASADLARLAALQAAMRLANQNLARAEQLFKVGTISKAELDSKQSAADQAVAQTMTQQEIIKQKTIYAPFAGQLGIRKVNIGEFISPGRPIVSLQSLDPIYVNFSISEQDLYHLKCGLEVFMQVSALKDIFTGQITAIEPGADPSTRNFEVQAIFANKDFKLRPGVFADVNVQLASDEQVIAIPRSAVSYNPYGNSVYVVHAISEQQDQKGSNNIQALNATQNDNNDAMQTAGKEFTVKRRVIKLGIHKGDMVAVVDGLVPGDVVATSGLLKLRNNSKVVINNTITPTAETR